MNVVWLVRRSLAEAEKSLAEAVGQRKAAEEQARMLDEQVRVLEAKLDEDGREFSDMELFRSRLTEEMEKERHEHQKDLEERDFAIDQMRKKYQSEY